MAIASQSELNLLTTLRNSFGTTGASSSKLLDASGIPKTSFYRALNALVTKGSVVNIGTKTRTHYVLAADMQEPLSPDGSN
jgi:DNA-binding IclR family transcriptional regulator